MNDELPQCQDLYLQNNLPITSWSVSDRPREKYIANGPQNLGNAELLAILLRTGTAKESAVSLAQRLLKASGNSLNRLSEMSVEELTRTNGIGHAKAVALHAAFELGRRRRAELVEDQKVIHSVCDVVEFMQCRLAEISHEEFWVIFINNASVILKSQRFSSGGLTSTTVDVRMIIKIAIELFATGLILCHNHPSGNLKPSHEDIALTQQIRKAAQFFNIDVRDHVILHGDNSFSFYEEGLL